MPFHNLYTNVPNACSLFRYVKKNTRCHSLYRGYNPDLLRFRWNRPKEVVVSHCHNLSSSPKSRWFYTKPYCCKLFTASLAALSPDGFYTKPYCCKLFTAPSSAAQNPDGFYTKPYCFNCSQTPQQSNGSSRFFNQTPSPQTVHNLSSFPRYTRILHQNLPLQAVHNSHIFPESSRIINHTLPRQAVHNRLKQNLILQLLSTSTET